MTSELLGASALAQAALVRSGEVSARELVESCLTAIERIDPEVGAFVAVCAERAVREADRVSPGDARPFCGVPFAVKDFLTATEGVPTTEGSRAFGDWVADRDSPHVRRLRRAGAILVGKTATPELAMRPVTETERFGVTRNPWDLGYSAGGSSGGSAAAVAAGMVALADGSDLGGSIRIPAACCGVVGFKPGRRRIPVPPAVRDLGGTHMAYGALTRTTADAAAALEVMGAGGPSPGRPAPPRRPQRVPVRVALDAPLGLPVDQAPLDGARRAAQALADLGHDVAEAVPPWEDDAFAQSWATHVTAAVQQLVRVLERRHGRPVDAERLEPATRAWAVDRPAVRPADRIRAVESLGALTRRILRWWPVGGVLLTPTLTRLPARVAALDATAGVSDDAVRFSAFVRLWNMTGQPAVSLPLHETDDGIPVGVQLVGPPGGEALLLSLAAELESAAGFRPGGRAPVPVRPAALRASPA